MTVSRLDFIGVYLPENEFSTQVFDFPEMNYDHNTVTVIQCLRTVLFKMAFTAHKLFNN
jgi:hypothetical protein